MKRSIIALTLVLTFLLSGCNALTASPDTSSGETNPATGETNPAGDTAGGTVAQPTRTDEDMFSKRDREQSFDSTEAVTITLNGDSASADSDAVTIDGTTITLSAEGTYILGGTLDDGMVIVDADKSEKLQIVLSGAAITSKTCAALYIRQADKVFLTLAEGTENTLANGGSFTAIDDNNIDGTLFSKDDLTLNGTGSLTITSPAGHGIVCKDDLVITGGSYTISAGSHGLDANDSIRIGGGELTVTAGKDGLHAENSDDAEKGFVYVSAGTLKLETVGDGISAGADMQLDGCDVDILAGGGSENGSNDHNDSFNGGGFMGGGHGGMGRPDGMQKPDGTDLPDGAEPPEGMELPDGMELPEGMEKPDDLPDGTGNPGEQPGGEKPDTTTTAQPLAATSDALTTTEDTSTKGLKATGNLVISGGNYIIDSADDAIHSNTSLSITGGTFQLKTGDDGIHADETVSISGGTIQITESYEGVEGKDVLISGGDLDIVSTDDGINAADGSASGWMGGMNGMGGMGGMRPGNSQFDSMDGDNTTNNNVPSGGENNSGSSNPSIVISGGDLYINASGDGIDSNGTLVISGGHTVIVGPTQGDTATLDFDISGVITGGTFIGTGASAMAQSFSDSQQGVIAVQVSGSAGTQITLTTADGTELISHTPELGFDIVIISTPELVKGETYTLTVGSSVKEFTAS